MSIEALKERLPDYAKDLKLNLSSLAAEATLTEQQRAGTFIASALAARNAATTEAMIAAFGKLNAAFNERDAVIYGVSIDSEYVHLAWRQNHADLKALPFPMLADIKRELATALGVLDKSEGVALRATFIVDPEGVIRFASVNDLNVGRNPQEVLRVLDALQTDELCPCNWQKGDEVLKAA